MAFVEKSDIRPDYIASHGQRPELTICWVLLWMQNRK